MKNSRRGEREGRLNKEKEGKEKTEGGGYEEE
jgi:hypothetical protein